MKRIFYFNINYGCNSNCVFCYSHNTRHNGQSFREVSLDDFVEYLERNNISKNDRVIINGGEPTLHSDFQNILESVLKYNCEVLIYSNGRYLKNFDYSTLNSNYRFIIPVHGYKELHDSITRVSGSFDDMKESLDLFRSDNPCLVDLKFILNAKMTENQIELKKSLSALMELYFNNAIHITQMAETPVSIKNNCEPVNKNCVGENIKVIFDFARKLNCPIKIFDTCVKYINFEEYISSLNKDEELEVYFKDFSQERKLALHKINRCQNTGCLNKRYCLSAVDSYTSLEINGNKVLVSLE